MCVCVCVWGGGIVKACIEGMLPSYVANLKILSKHRGKIMEFIDRNIVLGDKIDKRLLEKCW